MLHLQIVDAIIHLVRCFDDDNIIHVNNKIDPLSDIETINTELALADLESVEKQIAKIEKKAKNDKMIQDINVELDLSYIVHNRVIVMSYPASKFI